MPSQVPEIFDRAQLAVNRQRAAETFYKHDFLHQHVARELGERLALFKQDFARAVCLGSNGGLLRPHMPDTIAHLHEADTIAAFAPDGVLDEEHLILEKGGCNLIVALWGLHHVNDLPGALVQIRHALAPDGVFLAALPIGKTLHELRQAFLLAETEILGGTYPHVHPFADLRDLGDLLQRVGLALPVADSEYVAAQYQTPEALLRDLRGMGESNILTARARRPLHRAVLARAMAHYRSAYPHDEGGVCASFEIGYLTARAPAPTQAKPLRPGSATTRLADALKTKEGGF